MVDKGLWRNNASGKKDKKIPSPEELLQLQQQEEVAEEGDVAAPAKQIIVDMRCPQTKLLSSIGRLGTASTRGGGGGARS